MHTSTIHAPRHTEQKALHRAQKYTLLIAVALSVAALIAHHPGLVALVAMATVLVQILMERTTKEPIHHTAASFRFTDGGSFRSDVKSNALTTGQSVIVMDGGSH